MTTMKSGLVLLAVVLVMICGYLFLSLQATKEMEPVAHPVSFTLCETSAAHLGPQVIYRVKGELIDELYKAEKKQYRFIIPSDYLLFTNGCNMEPESLSREEIKKGYEKKKKYHSLLYVSYPDLSPYGEIKSYELTERPQVSNNSNLIIIEIQPPKKVTPYDLRPKKYDEYIKNNIGYYNLDEPQYLENNFVMYPFNPETATTYATQFDMYFQIENGIVVRWVSCKEDMCDSIFPLNKYVRSVYFPKKLLYELDQVDQGVEKLIEKITVIAP